LPRNEGTERGVGFAGGGGGRGLKKERSRLLSSVAKKKKIRVKGLALISFFWEEWKTDRKG